MPLPQDGISPTTPLGATPCGAGATLRSWAPNASEVALIAGADLASLATPGWTPADATQLVSLNDGTWAGFAPTLAPGQPYLFWTVGQTGAGPKRDPYARELATTPAFPNCPCVVIDPAAYPWQATGWRTPAFNDLVIYQLHVGTWWAQDATGADLRATTGGAFLDVATRLPYLQALGINAIQLLPIQEFETYYSLGYNGVDYFSPENQYQAASTNRLAAQLEVLNPLFENFGKSPISADQLQNGCDQLRCLIDLAHLHGIAVILDLVYNHAGGGFDANSLWFYDRQPTTTNNNSLYFTDQGWAGGQIFAYWNNWVSQFLIDNASMFLREYRVDGFRYDEVRVIENNGGRAFCQSLTSTVRYINPSAIQIAEYWNDNRPSAVAPAPDGLGFDAELGDGLRDALRGLLAQLGAGACAPIDLGQIAATLGPPSGIADAWRIVTCLENQDLTYAGHDGAARVPFLADSSNRESWFARSRARAATALLLTAPGIPMLFMGQEILEDKTWSDNRDPSTLIWWQGLATDKTRADFLRCTTDLLHLRASQPALRGPNLRICRVDNDNRVLVMHRWLESSGNDIIVIANFAEQPQTGYALGLPWPGTWRELFNSDVYDNFPNPTPTGNRGALVADNGVLDGFDTTGR
jgi:1,4-alpha-glucan branching enzyme